MFIRKTVRHRIVITGLLILIYILTLSTVSQFTSDTTLATKSQFNALLHGPSLAYLFGTDDFGRDSFTRVVVGMKLTFSISIILTVIVVIFGVLLGTIAGYFNHIDNLIMRILDVVFAIPPSLLAVAIVASFGAGILNLITALSIGNISSFTRTMRVSVLKIKRMEYVDAARITGENIWNIIWRHILSNATAPIIIRFSLNIGAVILTADSLNFLGLGVAPDVAEWGSILHTGSNYLETHSNLAIVSGVCIMFVVLAFNFIDDTVRDALDPGIH